MEEIKHVEHVIIRGDEIIILGTSYNDDDNHNCDIMGCTSIMCYLSWMVTIKGDWYYASRI
jgi:hypothetical protein